MSKLVASSSLPLIPRPRQDLARRPWHEPDWQRLWLATQNGPAWRSLAVVPGSQHVPLRFIEKAAVCMSRTGETHLGHTIHVADATKLRLADLNAFFAEVERCTSQGNERVVIALAPLTENVTSVSIAQKSDCALLCIVRGHTDTKVAKRTVREIGANRFIGAVMFDGIAD